MAPQPQLTLEQQQALAKARARRARATQSSGVPALLAKPETGLPVQPTRDPNAVISGAKPIVRPSPAPVARSSNRASRQLFDSALQDIGRSNEEGGSTLPFLSGVGKMAASAPMFAMDWMQDSTGEEKANLAGNLLIEGTGVGQIARLQNADQPVYGMNLPGPGVEAEWAQPVGADGTRATYDPAVDQAGMMLGALTAGAGNSPTLKGALREGLTNATSGISDLAIGGGKMAAGVGRNVVQKVAGAMPAPKPASVAPNAAPAGAGQQAGAATLNAAPAVQPSGGIQLAKSDAKIIGRLLRAGGVPRNDVDGLLTGLVQAYQGSNQARTRLALFAEEYLPQVLPQPVADEVVTKLRAFGNERLAATGPGDASRAIIQRNIGELRGSQEDYLTGVFENELGAQSLISTKGRIKGDKTANAAVAYKNSLAQGDALLNSGKATPEAIAARDSLLTTMGQPSYFKRIPDELIVKAENDPDIGGLWEYVHTRPLEAAHWLQSEFGRLARMGGDNAGLYQQMRRQLLNPLEDAVPGYRGTRKKHGDLFGQEIAVEFGNDLFAVGKNLLRTQEKADEYKRLSNAQKAVAEKSIRDVLKNEFRKSKTATGSVDAATGRPLDTRAAFMTQLQKDGTLDALERILGDKGKRIADAIRREAQLNDRLPAYGSDTAKNLAEQRAARDAVQSPLNRMVGDAGDRTGWLPSMAIDAGMMMTGTSPVPLLTAAKIGSKVVDKFGNPSPKALASATETLYGKPPPAAQTPVSAVSGPSGPAPKRAPPQRVVSTPELLETLLRQYDAMDHGRTPAASNKLMKRIARVRADLEKQGQAPMANALTSGAPDNAFAGPPINALTTPPSQNSFAPAAVVGIGGGTYGYNNPIDVDDDGEISDWERIASGVGGTALGAGGGAMLGNALKGGRNVAPGASQQTFGGINARTADKVKLARAQEMDAAGSDRRAIWDATGWFKGTDGKWRFEIDDSGARFQTPQDEFRGLRGEKGKLRDYVSHSGIEEAYPAMGDTPAQHLTMTAKLQGTRGAFGPEGYMFSDEYTPYRHDQARMSASEKSKAFGQGRSTSLHEMQHEIQSREGFGSGGNPDDFQSNYKRHYTENNIAPLDAKIQQIMRDNPEAAEAYRARNRLQGALLSKYGRLKGGWGANATEQEHAAYSAAEEALYASDAGKTLDELDYTRSLSQEWLDKATPDDIKNFALDQYRRLAGEVEARNVQTRRDFTPDQRRAQAPWETQDVPDDQQIVRFGPNGPQMSMGNALTRPPKGFSREKLYHGTNVPNIDQLRIGQKSWRKKGEAPVENEPWIWTTTDRKQAETFARGEGDTPGTVYELRGRGKFVDGENAFYEQFDGDPQAAMAAGFDGYREGPVRVFFREEDLRMMPNGGRDTTKYRLLRRAGDGAIGAVAGGLMAPPAEGDDAGKMALQDARNRVLQIENEAIPQIEADLRVFKTGTATEIQGLLDRLGYDLGPTGIDGDIGKNTKAAIREYTAKLEAQMQTARNELQTARERLKEQEAAAAYRASEAGPVREAFREALPWVGAGLGLVSGGLMRRAAVKNAYKKSEEFAENANKLLTPGTVSTGVRSPNSVTTRASNLNEFWQAGGAGESVPFTKTAKGEWRPRPKVAEPATLFPPDTRPFRGVDAAIAAGGVTESGIATLGVWGAEKELEAAQAAVDKDPSEANYARLQRARDIHSFAVAAQRLGLAIAVGAGVSAGKMPYKSKRPNVPAAEAEQALVLQAIARKQEKGKPAAKR